MTDDWVDFLFALLDHQVRFLVVGAHALAAHGLPRATQDLDVWIDASVSNVERVWHALGDFGAPVHSLGITRSDLERPSTVIQFGLPPNRIDVLTSISGVPDFEAGWNTRIAQLIRGRQVPFLGREVLIANKRAAGRPQDLADVSR